MYDPDTDREFVFDALNLEEDTGTMFECSSGPDAVSVENEKEHCGRHGSNAHGVEFGFSTSLTDKSNTLRHNDISNVSLTDSGFDSLNSSHTSTMLSVSSSSINSHVFTAEPSTHDETQSLLATPCRKNPPVRPKSPKIYEAKYPATKKKEHKRPLSGCPASGCNNSTQVSRLPTVMETEFQISSTLKHELEVLNREHDQTIRELMFLSSSDSSHSEHPTPSLSRSQSDAAMIKRMRKRGHKKGSRSDGDITFIGSPVTVNIHMLTQSGTDYRGDNTTPHNMPSNTNHQVKLPDEVLGKEVNSEVLLKLSQELTSWKFPARALGLSEAEIDQIYRDNQETKEQCFQMLRRWKDKYGQTATYQVLSTALVAMARGVYSFFVQIVLSHVS